MHTTPYTKIKRASACVAIFNNLLLIYLIVFRSHHKVGKYKYLMIYIAVFEMFYAVFDGCAVPMIYSKDSSFMVVIRADEAFLPEGSLLYFGTLFCVLFGISMAVFAIHFVYRYLVVSGSALLKNYENRIVTSLLAFPLVFGVFWFGVSFYFLHPYTEGNNHLRIHYLKKNNMTLSDVAYIGPLFWPRDSDGKFFVWWKSIIGIGIMTIGMSLSFAAIIFFGYKCYRDTQLLVEQASHSPSFHKLQSQLFIALVFQTIIPVVLMHIPASVGFFAAFIDRAMEPMGQFTSITICLYPALDPLPNFFFIKSYRQAIRGVFSKVIDVILCGQQSRVHALTGSTGSRAAKSTENSVTRRTHRNRTTTF